MQIVSKLHETLNPVFWDKLEKYCNLTSAGNFTESALALIIIRG